MKSDSDTFNIPGNQQGSKDKPGSCDADFTL